jgi:hypothetical protein
LALSIDLNNEARNRTEEVGEVRAYWHLAPELVAANLATAEARPHKPLDLRHIVPQFSGTLCLRRMHQRRIGLRLTVEN